MSEKVYDFVIIGSGLGGLECAFILAKEGYSVIVLEKNHQIGGNLQVFSRDKCVFDTGVHYIGSLDEGEQMYQYFKYFRLLDRLKMKRMDQDRFDVIRFADGKEYNYAQGYDAFIDTLVKDFPEEEQAIRTYCDKVREICEIFPLYNIDSTISHIHLNEMGILSANAAEYIESLTSNKRLQNVLAGNNPLYAGEKSKTPLYVHALILNSYITGSYRLVDGGSQIAKFLAKEIRSMGGEILKRKKVTGAHYNDEGHITEVVTAGGKTYKGKKFISNVHPAITIDLFGEDHFINAYKKRIRGLRNTISSFIVHIVLEKDRFPYLNYNIYQYDMDNVWGGVEYTQEDWPNSYFICTPATSKSEKWADAMTVMCYMRAEETEQWAGSHNTVAEKGERGAEYLKWKDEKEQKVVDKLEAIWPGIRNKIKAVYSSSPLTFRDYIGDTDGSMYGIIKDCNFPLKSHVNARTKIPNLFLTGQNVGLHGVFGVTISSFVTCFEFIDREKLINDVKSA